MEAIYKKNTKRANCSWKNRKNEKTDTIDKQTEANYSIIKQKEVS